MRIKITEVASYDAYFSMRDEIIGKVLITNYKYYPCPSQVDKTFSATGGMLLGELRDVTNTVVYFQGIKFEEIK